MRTESRMSLRFVCLAFATVILLALSAYGATEAPKWVGAFFVKGKVGLKWKPVEGAVSYNIYRKAEGDFEKIASADKTQYFDKAAVPGMANIYKIAAVDDAGAEVFSAEKSVNVAGGAVGAFKAPVWIGTRFDNKKAFLTWEMVPGAIAYNVYRSDVSGSGYDVVGNPTRNKYADTDVEIGKSFYYVISALNDEFEETEMSEERVVKCGMTKAELDSIAAAANPIVLEDITLTHLFTLADDDKPFAEITDVVVNSKGDIYVSDSQNKRVICYSNSGEKKFEFGTPTRDKDDPADGSFTSPGAMAMDPQDQIYVADATNGTIQLFSADGAFMKTLLVPGSKDGKFFSGGIAVHPDGRLIVVNPREHNLLFLDKNGGLIKSVGKRGQGDDEFNFPSQVNISPQGEVYVTDVLNFAVKVYDMDGNYLRRFGSLGRGMGQFGRPTGLSVSAEKVWVTDLMGHTVQAFNQEGDIKFGTNHIGGVEMASPFGVLAHGGRLYVVVRDAKVVVVCNIE